MARPGPLEGVRVADFTWAWAGPYATMLLSLMGAQVIKVESRARLDHSRMRSLAAGPVPGGPDEAPFFNDLNLGKLSVTLNLTHPKAVALARRLIALCDVVADNMRPGAMDRLGLGYPALREVKPDIIVLSASACGAKGPERSYAGYAPTFGGLGGLAYITGYPDGLPGTLMGSVDLRSAVSASFAIMAALCHRRRTGQGQYIDFSSQEAISVLMGEVVLDYTMNGRVQSRTGNQQDALAPHRCYRCRGEDKWVSIAVTTEEEWRALCRAIGKSEWLTDERFSDGYRRWQHREELDRLISEWTGRHTHYEVMETLQKAGVAAAPSFNSQELFRDPHSRERDIFQQVEHPRIGKRWVVGPPWKMSATPPRVSGPGPLLGQHNPYVFGELLGLSPQEIAELQGEGAIH
ncbi:MAG: CoA transferase [Chloroflexota bacterium]|nr:CoA transferase [Chloroflexota bacterium]